jgi:hypothetical protein
MGAEVMAREVAKELRKRGIWARAGAGIIDVPRMTGDRPSFWRYLTTNPDFDNMTDFEIADEIVAQERLLAQEWAGDT